MYRFLAVSNDDYLVFDRVFDSVQQLVRYLKSAEQRCEGHSGLYGLSMYADNRDITKEVKRMSLYL